MDDEILEDNEGRRLLGLVDGLFEGQSAETQRKLEKILEGEEIRGDHDTDAAWLRGRL